MMTAQIVIGLGFGDEGKGLTTDFLCSQNPNSIVVRFSGGQQAGHTVIYNGKKHIHSNFGSGTLRGVPSYFSEHCCFYLNTIEKELNILKEKGIEPTLYIHPLAKLTTPFDVAYNRMKEEFLKHGSCGLGVGSTMERQNSTPLKLYAIDLLNVKVLNEKLKIINQEYKRKSLYYNVDKYMEYCKSEWDEFSSLTLAHENPIKIVDYSKLLEYDNIIFEGSQGIMLDMDHGIFPNVTYASTTSKNAISIYKSLSDSIVCAPEIYYVTRCYQTRHGAGYMSNDKLVSLLNTEEEINVFNKWQGEFKTAELDYDLLNYALAIDDIYSFSCKKNLIVTCLDQRPEFIFNAQALDTTFESIYYSSSPESKNLTINHDFKSGTL